jgi:hypothetical protein
MPAQTPWRVWAATEGAWLAMNQIFSAIYISVITDTDAISAYDYLCCLMRAVKSFIVSILTSSIGDVCIFAKANKDASKSTGIEFSAFVGGDDSNIFVYTTSKIGVGTNPEVGFVLTNCSSDCHIMNIYDSDNCETVFKCHFGHSVIFSSSDVFDIHAYITSILFDCKSFYVDTISCETKTRLTLITNDFHHHFTTTGSDERSHIVDPYESQQPETCNWYQISAMFTDILVTNEIDCTTSIGGCDTTTTPTIAPATTTTKRCKRLTDYWGGG